MRVVSNDGSSELIVPFFVTRSVKRVSETRKKKRITVSHDLQIHKLWSNANLLTYIARWNLTKQGKSTVRSRVKCFRSDDYIEIGVVENLNKMKMVFKWISIFKFSCFFLLLFAVTSCGYPGSPSHAVVTFTPDNIRPGTVATYECEPGFELLGPSRRLCSTNGTWTPAGIPFCGESLYFSSFASYFLLLRNK
jgi:hypothetical protein